MFESWLYLHIYYEWYTVRRLNVCYSEGKQTEAVQHLEKFAEISMSNKQDENLEKAYTYLGSILNSRVRE